MNIIEPLYHKNFIIYCAKHYDNPYCANDEEFFDDINKIKYIKKLLTRYHQTGELKERLILNHIMVLYNIFGASHVPRILYLKCRKQFHMIKPFLILLNCMPRKLYNIGNETIIDTDEIPLDQIIIDQLRKI